MASAKRTKVKSHMTGKTVKVECPECYDEFGSEACIRPAHGTFAHIENQVKDIVKITQDAEKPVGKEVLAASIVAISESVNALYKTGLNKRAVIALIADDTKLGKGTIMAVLNSISDLQKNYTTPKGTNSRGPM